MVPSALLLPCFRCGAACTELQNTVAVAVSGGAIVGGAVDVVVAVGCGGGGCDCGWRWVAVAVAV